MHLSPEETSVLNALGEQGSAMVDRAVGWCAVNSGSRNIPGLETTVAILSDVFAVLPGELVQRPLAPSIEIAADGREKEQAHTPAIAVTVRPDAPCRTGPPERGRVAGIGPVAGRAAGGGPRGRTLLSISRRE